MLYFICDCLTWSFYVLSYLAHPLGWLVLILSSLRTIIGPTKFEKLRHWQFSLIMNMFHEIKIKKGFHSTKIELFETLKEMKSSDPDMMNKNALHILEVGAGTGTNFEFFPAGSQLTCIDPNAEFGPLIRRAVKENATHLDPDIKFVCGRGEDMSAVPDASMDAVVVTLVLCSVEHQDSFFKEIRRVLVPGGKFFFLEHVGGEQGTWRRRLQNVFSDSGLWPAIFVGCNINRETRTVLMKAGFASVDCKTVSLKDVLVFLSLPNTTHQEATLVNPFLVGTATK